MILFFSFAFNFQVRCCEFLSFFSVKVVAILVEKCIGEFLHKNRNWVAVIHQVFFDDFKTVGATEWTILPCCCHSV